MPLVEVRSRALGCEEPLPSVRIAADRLTVRELIRLAVEEQVRELAAQAAAQEVARQASSPARHLEALRRQYLTPEEVREQAASGRVALPSPPTASARSAPQSPDPRTEVARAVRAFERGSITIFVGGRQVTALDEEVTVGLANPVVFLRLVPLAGG